MATSDYMLKARYSAQWLQSKPITDEKPLVIIFSHTVIYFTCCTSSKIHMAKLSINIIYRSRAVIVFQKR